MSETLYAHEQGDGDAVIVLLHGFVGSHASWAKIQGELANGARTIAFDLPGFGESLGYENAGPAKVAAKAVLGELNKRKTSGVHLVGHSMGGAVAALAALAAPTDIASLTLLAPGGFGTEINYRLLQHFAATTEPDAMRLILENMYGWNNPVAQATVDDLVAMRERSGQTDMLVKIGSYLARDGKQGVIPRAQLATLDMPVKVIWGTQDRVLPTRQAHRLPGCFAAHIFEDTGHMLPDEIPDAVCQLVRENIRKF